MKKHSLYKFLFKILITFSLIVIFGTFCMINYSKYKMADKILLEIEKRNSENPFLNINFEKHNKEYYEFLNYLSSKTQLINLTLFNENEQLILQKEFADYPKKIRGEILNKPNTVDKLNYDLILISSSEVYFYFQNKLNVNENVYYINILEKIEEDYLDNLKNDIYFMGIITLVTIFITVISLIPIFYMLYKRLLDLKNEILISNINILIGLGNTIAKRDSDTNEHNYRVTYYSLKIAEKINLKNEQITSLIKGAFLHDIGKIAISDNILLKPTSLTKDEFEIMKTHVNHGMDIIKDIPWLEDAKRVILFHHEKVDGSGYPNGISKNQIPIESRIFSIADVFDALSSKRPYKDAFDIHESFKIMRNDSNVHFDEDIINAFELIYEEIYYDVFSKNSKELKEILEESLKPYFFNKINFDTLLN